MTIKEIFAVTGSDYEDVIKRFGSEALVRKFVLKFTDDPSFGDLKEALHDGRTNDAFRAAHTLKGICINLGFSALYRPTADLTEILRGGTLDGSEELFDAVSAEYTGLISAISEIDE